MKESSLKLHLLGLLCSLWLPATFAEPNKPVHTVPAQPEAVTDPKLNYICSWSRYKSCTDRRYKTCPDSNYSVNRSPIDEYVVDADSDPIILDCAIALLAVCVVFLLCVIIVQFVIYKKIKDTKGVSQDYHVSQRETEENAARLGPFYGQAMYSRKNTNSIYLPGRQNVMGRAQSKYGGIYDVSLYEESGVTTDSPSLEKGQIDSMVSEKIASRSRSPEATSYENEAYAAGVSSFSSST